MKWTAPDAPSSSPSVDERRRRKAVEARVARSMGRVSENRVPLSSCATGSTHVVDGCLPPSPATSRTFWARRSC